MESLAMLAWRGSLPEPVREQEFATRGFSECKSHKWPCRWLHIRRGIAGGFQDSLTGRMEIERIGGSVVAINAAKK